MSTTDTSRYRPEGRESRGSRRLLIAVTALSLLLWYIPGAHLFLYPLRLFVTFIHEGGHALMTILTGGGVDYIGIAPDTSGITMSMGGSPLFIYMAGYLGATLFGALCLLAGRGNGNGRRGLTIMAVALPLITALWVRNPFGLVTGVVLSALLILLARTLRGAAADFTSAFLAVQLCLNALFDLRNLVWITTQTNMDNDAKFMAQTFGLTPWFWAILWALGALMILYGTLRVYWRSPERTVLTP